MLTFILSVLSLYLSVKALKRVTDIAKKKRDPVDENPPKVANKLPSDKEKFYHFLISEDSTFIFKETQKLFEKAITEAIENESFGSVGHHTTLTKTIYNFKIQLTITPTEIEWEVFDLSQDESFRSHYMFAMRYSRSLKTVTYDEFRINEGNEYSYDKTLNYSQYGTLPISFIRNFNLLNDSGWNKNSSSYLKTKNVQPAENEMEKATNRIVALLEDNQNQIDTDVYGLFQSIVQLVENILNDELVYEVFTENSDIEFKHDLKRLLEQELLKILQIYLELDDIGKKDVKNMTTKSLEKAHNQLVKKYTSFQHERKSALKQIHLVMEERYD